LLAVLSIAGVIALTMRSGESAGRAAKSDAGSRVAMERSPRASEAREADPVAAASRSAIAPAADAKPAETSETGIDGRVVDAATGAPIARFSVSPRWPDGDSSRPRPIAFDSPDGTFSLRELAPRAHYLAVSADGYATGRSFEVQVAADRVARDVVVKLRKGATLRGKVIEARTGAPVANAAVVLSYEPAVPFTGSVFAKTREDGTFELKKVAAGTLRALANHDRFPPAASPEIDVAAGTVLEIPTIAMSQGGAIEGTVVATDGKPAAKMGMNATCERTTSGALGYGQRSGATDERGAFRLEGLDPGTWEVEVRVAALNPKKQEDEIRGAVVVVAGETARLDLGLPADACTLRGRLLRDGEGLPRARVEVRVVQPMRRQTAVHDLSVETDESGRFEIPNVPPGGHSFIAYGALMNANLVVSVEVPDVREHEIEVVVPKGGGISGRIVSRASGRPIERMNVSAQQLMKGDAFGVNGWAESDSDGRFSIPRLPPGSYRVLAGAHPGVGRPGKSGAGLFAWKEATVEVAVGADATADLALDAAASVIVEVVDRDGMPIQMARVRFGPRSPQVYRWQEDRATDARGLVKIDGLGADEYALDVGGWTKPADSVPIRLKPGEERRVRVVLGKP